MCDAVVGVLGDLVGRPVAQICISSAAIRLGKSADGLEPSDLEAVLDQVRDSMRSFTSVDVLNRAVDDIRLRVDA